MKTFRIPKLLLEKWLAALRSGKYKQGVAKLQTADGSYCCLGVLQMVADGKVETWDNCEYGNIIGESRGLPTPEWMKKNGITGNEDWHVGAEMLVTDRFNRQTSVSILNDDGSHSFADIADRLEVAAEAY